MLTTAWISSRSDVPYQAIFVGSYSVQYSRKNILERRCPLGACYLRIWGGQSINCLYTPTISFIRSHFAYPMLPFQTTSFLVAHCHSTYCRLVCPLPCQSFQHKSQCQPNFYVLYYNLSAYFACISSTIKYCQSFLFITLTKCLYLTILTDNFLSRLKVDMRCSRM